MAARFNMCSVWSCSSCLVWLLGAVLPSGASASQLRRKETLHRVEKVYVTTQLLGKRDESSCPANFSLCPASLSGGCCPDRYACGTESCTATTAGTTSACGRRGYYACGIEDGGGCCPEGYICGKDCSAPPGVSQSQTCPGGYYLCPASLNFGCCQNSMGCGLNACFATTPVTNVFTQTLTTTTDGNTITTTRTATTVATPSKPTSLPTEDAGTWPKLIPTTQPKATATVTQTQTASGLTQAQLGGIIGGVVVVLVIVLAAAFIIVRKLHRTEKVLVESRKGSSTGDRNSRPSNSKPMRQYNIPTPSQVDHMEYDDLLQRPTGQSASTSAFSTPTPLPSSTSVGDGRNASIDTSQGYFELPPRVQNKPGRHSMSTDMRTSIDSGNAHVHLQEHSRHYSNASELSDGSVHGGGIGSPLLPAELGTEGSVVPELPMSPITATEARRRSNSGIGVSPASPPLAHTRRRIDGRDRSGSFPVSQQPQSLDVVNESVEHLHGFYGRPDVAAGQTRAMADLQHDISSPLAPQFQRQPFPR